MKIPQMFIPEKDFGENIERLLKEEIKPAETHLKYSKFEVIRANTYAEGIAVLKEKGFKPFTFAENVEARIADYEANGENAELFKVYLDSITGIAYKKGSTKFKVVLRSDRLENIPQDFNQSFIPIRYNAEQGVELDSKKGEYNRDLTREEVKNHEFWITVIGGDKEKLAEYVNIWFYKTGKEKSMGVYLRDNTSQDELRALVLFNDNLNSNADGYVYLDYSARFVSGA